MDILSRDYPDEVHVFAYDNATIHTCRPADALSARYMPLNVNANFRCTVKKRDGTEEKVKMKNGVFPDGTPQELYFPDDHPQHAGKFKGTRNLIIERREKGVDLPDPVALKLKAQCKGFKCAEGATTCCCRRILFTQPDFVNQKSRLEEHCEARGFEVIFFPKYHPELNCIEQCWGFAKRIYRMYPTSSKEADLEANLVSSLEAVPLVSIRRYVPIFAQV
jgi:hypothetical protein